MGKIVGDKKKTIISFTQEEVKEFTSDLNKKIAELTIENVKLNDEKDSLLEIIDNLNKKIAELTTKDNDAPEKVGKKTKKETEKLAE